MSTPEGSEPTPNQVHCPIQPYKLTSGGRLWYIKAMRSRTLREEKLYRGKYFPHSPLNMIEERSQEFILSMAEGFEMTDILLCCHFERMREIFLQLFHSLWASVSS